MGMNMPSSSGSRRAMSEINVTPFVDVMLVLLIIFMVTAPMMKQGLNVDLPEAKSTGAAQSKKKDPITVSIKKTGKVFIGNTEVAIELLSEKIKSITETSQETRVYVEADKKVAYESVAKVMGELQAAGIFNISLITIPKDI